MKNKGKLFTFIFSGIFMIVGIVLLIGGIVTLIISRNFMEHVESNGGMTFLYGLFMGMGILFIIISIIPIIISLRNSSRREKILKSGRKFYATIEEIALNTSLSVNGQHPYVIYCTWKDDYKDMIYRFKSGSIWTNPNLALRPGDMIPVYVEENNYRHYYVDTESILNNRITDYT